MLLIPIPAGAQQDAGPKATAGAGAEHVSLPALPGKRSPGRELDDWRDRVTGSTIRHSIGCEGLTVEAMLTGTGTRNYLDLTLANDSRRAVTLLSSETVAVFGSGLTRRLGPLGPGDTRLLPDWWLHTVFVFPEKSDFAGQQSLLVQLSVADDAGHRCGLQLHFQRRMGAAPNPATHVAHSRTEIHFGAGIRVATTGGVEELGSVRGLNLELGARFFPWFHHGLSFALSLEHFGSDGIRQAAADLEVRDGAAISATGVWAGYAVRWYWLPWLATSYGLSSGPYIVELNDGRDAFAELTTVVFPLRQQLRLPARVARFAGGAELTVGTCLDYISVPYGRLGETALRGSSLAAQLFVGLGE
jgi:hypothetical protein